MPRYLRRNRSILAPSIRDGVFVTNSLILQVFTIIVTDNNIDLNARCNKIKQNFHRISMTTMQFPTGENSDVLQEPLYDFGSDHTNKKLNIPDAYVNLKELPFEVRSSLFAPVCAWNLDDKMFQTREFDLSVQKEISWLDSVSNASINNCRSWSKFHSSHSMHSDSDHTVRIHALMPMIIKKVSSIKSQFHCMNIITNTIKFINKDQVPVDASDQSVFALSREV